MHRQRGQLQVQLPLLLLNLLALLLEVGRRQLVKVLRTGWDTRQGLTACCLLRAGDSAAAANCTVFEAPGNTATFYLSKVHGSAGSVVGSMQAPW